MSILKHSSSEYYIKMRDDSDLESFDDGLSKLCDDEVITDFDNTVFDAVLSGMSGAFESPNKEVHIYIERENDTVDNWKEIGCVLGMSFLDLHQASKLVTKIYNADFKDMPKGSLWDKPLPGAKEVEDYHGGMITLSRLDQFKEDNSFVYDWLDECLLFYLDTDEDTAKLMQGIERLLLQTEED